MTARERVFLGVALPEEARHRLATQLERLVRRRAIPGSRVPIASWHITLRFIGLAGGVEQDRILAHLDQADLGGSIDVRLSGLGAFPKPSNAAVVWIGVEAGAEALTALSNECEEAVVRAGLPPEDRPFHPHMTLSRVRPPVDATDLVEIFDAESKFTVEELALFRSVPQHRRPMRYEVVDTVAL